MSRTVTFSLIHSAGACAALSGTFVDESLALSAAVFVLASIFGMIGWRRLCA